MDPYKERFNKVGHEYNEASSAFPEARENERFGVIGRMDLKPKARILDAPAGGAYLAEGILKAAPQSKINCHEPSTEFAKAIPAHFSKLVTPLDQVPLADASIDNVASLAGLHHVIDRKLVFREWHRILKPGGQVVVADVALGTEPDYFLNQFVDKFSATGHVGDFFASNDFTTLLNEGGFDVISDECCLVPWKFPSEEGMVQFCKQLFSVQKASDSQVYAALEKIGINKKNESVLLNWTLQYAVAFKP